MHQESLISAKSLNFYAKERHILQNIDLAINQGDFITIMGPNGAGKSLLIKCMLGIIKPTSGTIIKNKGLVIGYMPQNLHIERTMPITVKDFMRLNNPPIGKDFDSIVDLLKIDRLLGQFTRTLSNGEWQKILLGRALLRQPNLLVMDEPSQNLDYNAQSEFYHLCETIYENHKIAILMISHDLHFVLASSTEVICLYHHICCRGAAEAIGLNPKFQAIFGHDNFKSMAIYNHTHKHNHHHD